MRKTVKLEEETYRGVDRLRGKGDTFDAVITRLLCLFDLVNKMLTEYTNRVQAVQSQPREADDKKTETK